MVPLQCEFYALEGLSQLMRTIGSVQAELNQSLTMPRRRFDKDGLNDLAASIRQKGIVQPILLRPNPEKPSRYQLVAGERRWRAAQLAKIHQVPAIIRDLTEAECYEIALIENIQRSDLSVIEEAQGYQKLLETNRYTQEQVSEIIGKSRSHIANLLRLLLLPPSVQTLLLDRKITMGQARPLIGHGDADSLARVIVAKGLSARQAEMLAKQDRVKTGKKAAKPEKSADIKALERQAADKLGLAFQIDWDEAKERGKVVIDCQSLEQMTNLLAKLGIR
ncbi:MAG: ParB/RepB/Spo0J family partition protein [Alphaproteobacteria bacterium]|nr:ParB/RepB/Spo0J family partition protein [Alphaproteobacteria bacterium]